MRGIVNRHKTHYEEDHVADIIDCYFKERDDRRKKGDPAAEFFTGKVYILTLYILTGSFLFNLLVHCTKSVSKLYG